MTVDQLVDERIAAALNALRRNPPPPRLALTLDEAGASVGVSAKTVDRWVKAGLLPTVPHTTRVLVPVIALEQFVSATIPADTTPPGSTGSDVRSSSLSLLPDARGAGDRGARPTAGGEAPPPAA